MTRRDFPERRLLDRISLSPQCRALSLTATPGDEFGVLIWRRGTAIGLWSWHENAYIYRNLSGWQVLHRAADIEQALRVTIDVHSPKP